MEVRLGSPLSLAVIAQAAGVSRCHLVRAFGAATGRSVMRYLRARRLTEAAKRLAAGTPDILGVALDAGYGSHEAFTRAFRDQFDTTLEAVRAHGQTAALTLLEAFRMDETQFVPLEPPRFETGRPLLIAGLGRRYTFETNTAIPQQWQSFQPHIGHVPGQVGRATYGVCCHPDGQGRFEYIAGVEVSDFIGLPAEFSRIAIPQQRYAVFSHRAHVSKMRDTVYTIWNQWLPASGYQGGQGPDFELYDERFDPLTGSGTIEIWLPVGR